MIQEHTAIKVLIDTLDEHIAMEKKTYNVVQALLNEPNQLPNADVESHLKHYLNGMMRPSILIQLVRKAMANASPSDEVAKNKE